MNERILELAKQADPDHWHSRWYSGINPRVMDPEIKKFAELIVRECAYISEGYFGFKDHTPGTVISKEIKEHFGIE